ncbi:MAG: hypothetical protein WBL19_01210 [Minisyncoccia bacterium]
MQAIYLPLFYLKWHYSEAFGDLYRNWKSFLAFTLHLFSMKLLFRTWLSPLGRLNEGYKKSFDLEDFMETFVVNTMMRLIGFLLRTFVIVTGVLVFVVAFFLGLASFALWAVAPLVIASLFIQGLLLLLA